MADAEQPDKSNIVGFRGWTAPTPFGEPVKTVVDCIESYLALAKSGDLVAVAIAGVIRDGSAIPSTSDEYQWEVGYDYALESSLNRLVRRYGRDMDGLQEK